MNTDQHYSHNLSVSDVETILTERFPEGANSYQLAPLDQLHIGGVKASEKIVDRIKSFQPKRILDIGSGPGGLGRLVLKSIETDYTGLDITHELNRLNKGLSQHHEGNFDIPVLTGDAQTLPFKDDAFDLIIMQHTLLNIPNKDQALHECRRVLAPNGKLILHEVVSGTHPEQMQFPVPWASQRDQSHLITSDELKALFEQQSACDIHITDWTDEALSWRKRQSSKEAKPVTKTAPLLSPAVILGADFKAMGANVQKNLSSGAIGIVEIVVSF